MKQTNNKKTAIISVELHKLFNFSKDVFDPTKGLTVYQYISISSWIIFCLLLFRELSQCGRNRRKLRRPLEGIRDKSFSLRNALCCANWKKTPAWTETPTASRTKWRQDLLIYYCKLNYINFKGGHLSSQLQHCAVLLSLFRFFTSSSHFTRPPHCHFWNLSSWMMWK